MMPKVSDICTKDVISIDIGASLSDAVKLMTESNVRSLLVTEQETQNYFIFTINDAIKCKIKNIPAETSLFKLQLSTMKQIDANTCILEITNQNNDYEYMIVLDNNKTVGILSQTDVINNIDPQILLKKQSISSILLQYTVQTVYENEATINAIKIMKQKEIDSVIILNNENSPIGIFTTKDFLTIICNNVDLNLPIKNYMSSPLETLPQDVKIYDALEFIRIKHFKRIIVTDENDKIAGVITQQELLRLINNKWMEVIKHRGEELSKINEELMEKTSILEEKASKDFLTKLYNRRKFDALLHYEIEQIKRYNHGSLSLIIIDIDNFKPINDIHGHDTGDEILKAVGNILNTFSRETDIVSRWGGEEFTISLSHTNIDEALLVAEKLRATIERHTFAKDLNITCSFGISQYKTTDTPTELFKRADEALYEAKNTGKNRVVLEQL